MMLKFYFFLIINLFCFGILYSDTRDNSIMGEVVDSKTFLPIENVNIIFSNEDFGSSTNIVGKFEFYNLKRGDYQLKITHIGYKEQLLKVEIPLKKDLIIKLEKSSFINDPIMVTGMHIERPLSDSPIITEIISRNEIERYSSSTVLDLLEKVIPNIQIRDDSHGTTMTIQGLDSKYFLFLIDGNRMTGETTGNIDFSRLNTSNIERIEVLNGGASTSYGSGAIGGVINIITKYNKSPYLLRAGSKMYSENHDQNNWLSMGYSNKYFDSQTNYTKKSSDGYKVNGDVIQNMYSDFSLNQILRFNINSKLKMYVSGTFYEHDTEDYNYNNKRRDKYYDKQFILNLDYGDLEKLLVKFKCNIDKYDKFTLFEALNDDERIRSSHNLNLYNFNVYKTLNKNNLYFGFENYSESFYSPTDLSYNPFAGYLGLDSLKSSTISSLFFQNEINLFDKTQIVGGVRYDASSAFGNHLGPHLSILYKNKNFNFRLNSSKNFKAPTLKELYMSWDHLGMFYVNGNENLKPEISKYLSGSIEFYKSKYNLTIKSYIHLLDNMIASVEDFEFDQMVYKNFKSVSIQGIDLYFKTFIYNNLVFNSTLSFIDPRDISQKRQLDGTNKISINSNLIFNLFEGNQNININYKFLSETYNFAETIPKYHVVNFSYNWNINNFIKISSGIDNLVNTASLENRSTIYPDTRYFINLSIDINSANKGE